MGFEIKFNWALQIEAESSLAENSVYDFSKKGNRVFPIDTPIDLLNLKREAVAKIKVLEFTNTGEETNGKFKVVKIYKDEEKRILTNYWIENE